MNGFIKPFSDNEQLSEVGNGKIPLPARWQFGVFGGPKKGILAGRGVPNFGHTLFMAALAYPCRKIFARLWSKTAFELPFPAGFTLYECRNRKNASNAVYLPV